MGIRGIGSPAASVSHTEEKGHKEKGHNRRKRRFHFNTKSCMALVMSAALLVTSFDGMIVHAEELVPPVSGEETPGVSENTTENQEKSPYRTDENGAVLISSFEPLLYEESHIKLVGEKKTLDEVLELITVKKLTAYVTPAPEDKPEEGEPPVEGETDPGEGEQPGGETNPGEGEQPGDETNPGEGEQPGGETNPGEGEQPGGETTPGEGEQPGGETTPGEGDQPGGETNPGEGEQPGGETNPGGGDQPGGETNPGGVEDQPGTGDDSGTGSGDQGASDDGSGDNGDANGGNGDQSVPDSGDGGADSTDNAGDGSDAGDDSHSDGQGEAEPKSSAGDTDDVAAAAKSGAFAGGTHSWRFLVETGESGADPAGDQQDHSDDSKKEGGSAGGTESGDAGTEDNTTGGSEGGSAGGTEDNAGGSESGGTDGTEDNGGAEGGIDGSEGGGAGETEGGAGGNDGGGENGTEGGTGGNDGNGAGGTDGSTGGSQDGSTDDTAGSVAPGGDSVEAPGTEEGENTPPGIAPDEGAEIPDGQDPDTAPPADSDTSDTEKVEVEVTWECANYDTETEERSYTFVPKWDEAEWSFKETEENRIPTVEVVYTEPGSEVSTEEELAAAFAAGLGQITLKNDIFLTKPLKLPAAAKIELDGKGFSLFRGTTTADDGSSSEFTGVMICMDGADYTDGTYGRLTLKDIIVDGKTETADHAGAPAILDKGELILETGAVVTNNDNHGTSPEADGEGVEEILPYGGGIQVYGKLTVMEGSSITKNRAEERGGGVYLFSGSMLELYADVIKDNSVGLVGGKQYGADLYAEEGSRIYFDPSIDMDRPEFYICEGVIPSPQKPPADAARKELYIYVNEDSGYTSSQIAELKAELGKMGYIVLEGRTDIDTTDLQDWYVYDHYDTNCWSEEEWKAEGGYGDNEKRKYYPYTAKNSSYYHFPGGTDDPEGKNVTTIEAWLDNPDYGTGRNRYLAQFKEHIYVRPDPKGSALMTFVGYGEDPLVDFMYYDPKSDGEKVVDFDVDSTVVDTHTLLGNGFLVNTGVDENGNLSGYLVLYTYSGQNASALILYRVQGQADRLHQGPLSSTTREITRIGINGSDWKDLMSVQIRVTPNKIAVRQQPQDQGTDISKAAPILEYDIPAGDVSGYSGFGPLVAYGSHGCSDASSFTYSDLRMYYTNPRLAGTNMLSPVEKADFTQVGMQKYFVDLFGGSGYYFNEMDRGDLYHEYMKMMQTEGIALVTDRKTPFAPYLGEANGSDSNLFELGTGGPLPNPKELAQRIHNSISSKGSTELEEKVEQGALTEPSPKGSVGNIWLKSVETGEQIRETLYGNDFPDSGYQIQVIDDSDIAYYHEGATGVTYEILKPKAKDYETLGLSTAPSQYPITIPKGGQADWPAGFYTVRQKVDGSGVDGYAYFTLEWRDTPIPTYTVTVKVNKDGEEWPDHGKDFWLRPSAGGSMIRPSGAVTAGNYGVYERVKFPYSQDINTGVSVEVKNLPKTVTVDYYTVTFYDGPPSPEQEPNAYGDNTAQKRQYVLKTGRVSQPANPAKDRHNFTGWINENGENFDFRNTAIQEPGTKIYATWDRIIYPVAVGLKVQKDGSEWSDHGKEFRLRPEGSDTPVKVSEMKQFSDKLFAGKYAVYDVTGLSEDDIPEDGRDTGRSVEVTAEDTEDPATAPKEVTVDYYTVTFYDGPFSPEQEPNAYGDDTAWKPQIVLAGTGVDQSLVDKIPTKDKHEFSGWVNKDGEKLDLLNVTINGTTGVYAEWDRMKYPVTVGLKVQKDDEEWNGHGKEFRLCPKGGDAPVKVSEMKPFTEKAATVSAGTYTVYDVTGLNEDDVPGNDRDTGCSVEVTVEDTENSDTQPKEVTVDYYTVTFYDGLPSSDQKPEPYGKDTDWKEQTVLKGKPAVCPAAKPEKDKYAFLGWASAEEKGFNFNEGIRGTTGIYAMWEKIEEPRYKVTVNARRDGGGWEDAGRIFALRPEGGEQFISNLDEVKAGTYRIYDITGGSPVSRASRAVEAPVNVKVDDGDTGITVTVADGNVTRDVDYYTVTFYDGKNAYGTDTSQSPLIVLGGKTAAEPEASPDKKGYRFTGWFTADDGKTAFDFAQAIRNKTDIYAGWKANRKEPPKEKKPEPEDTPGGGDTRIVTVSQEAAPQNGTVQTASAQTPEEPASGTGEPRTGDTTQIQIYATVAMIAGLTYLLLYFMEESRGMTEREKEVFVAAFIRWAKKGGRFRRCCAIVAIFCILVYYHSIGKRAGRNSVDREYLKQAL